MIIRVQRRFINYLLFGDYDNLNGIENLLETSAQNEREYMRIREERDALGYRYYLARSSGEQIADIITEIRHLNSEAFRQRKGYK